MATNEATLRVEVAKPRGKGEGSDEHGDGPDLSTAPIFASLEGDQREELDHVVIDRLAPVREGQLGRFESDVTEADIFERHGGGKYRVQGRTRAGRPLKGAFNTLELAGEPILRSRLARKQYAQMLGQDSDEPGGVAGVAGASMTDLMLMLEKTRTTAEAERERRADEEEKRHSRELARIKAEQEARIAERAAEDERRRKEEDARDEKRRREEEERRRRDKEEALEREAARKRDEDERRSREKREEEERRQREREWQATMMQMQKAAAPAPGADPVAMLMAGVKLAQGIGGAAAAGAGDADPVSSLIANLPATVSELGKIFRGGQPGAPGAASPDDLVVTGELGKKGNAAVAHVQAQGMDPAAVLNNAFDLMLQIRGNPQQQQQGAQAAPAAAGAGPAPPRRGPGGRPMAPRAPAAAAPAPARPPSPPPVDPAKARDGFVATPAPGDGAQQPA